MEVRPWSGAERRLTLGRPGLVGSQTSLLSNPPAGCRPTTSGPCGIWGHDVDDLSLRSMKKLREGYWVLDIDS